MQCDQCKWSKPGKRWSGSCSNLKSHDVLQCMRRLPTGEARPVVLPDDFCEEFEVKEEPRKIDE